MEHPSEVAENHLPPHPQVQPSSTPLLMMESQSTHHAGQMQTPKQRKQYQWSSEAKRMKSFETLLKGSQTRSKDAFEQHRSTVMAFQGQFLDTLSTEEKERIQKARTYFHCRMSTLRKKGDVKTVQELKELLELLPSSFVVRHQLTGPLTEEQLKRKRKLEMGKEARDRKEAQRFMQREFGHEIPMKKLGPKFKDLSQMDPVEAQKFEERRAYHAQRWKRLKMEKLEREKGQGTSSTPPAM